METTKFWEGGFGDEYTQRNRVQWRHRIPFWRYIIQTTRPDNVLEVGCNAGWNLRAITEASPGTKLVGVDINTKAVTEARQLGFDVHRKEATEIQDLDLAFDLVFTAGVLIHVAPTDLIETMQAIIRRTSRHVLAVEYAANKEEEVNYRGNKGKLWRRPFGELYKALGLKELTSGGAAQGFDNCEYWLLEKQ